MSKNISKQKKSQHKTLTLVSLSLISLILIAAVLIIIITSGTKYVYFETNDGTKIERVKVDRDGHIEWVTPPTKDKFIFNGWYLDETLLEYVDITTYTFEEDTTVYARYISFFSEDLINDFYVSYLYDLDNGRYEDSGFQSYCNSLGVTTPNYWQLISFIAQELSSSSSIECYNALSKEIVNDQTFISNLITLPRNCTVYRSGNKEYYRVNGSNYANVNDPEDVVTDISDMDEYQRTNEYYLNKPRNAIYVKTTRNSETTYVNVLDSSNIIEYIQILDLYEFIGDLKIGTDNLLYVYYSPLVSGYKTTDFITYLAKYMEYSLFDKVYNDYHTFQYARMLLEVFYELNPNYRSYVVTDVDKYTELVKTRYFKNIVDFADYDKREEELEQESGSYI